MYIGVVEDNALVLEMVKVALMLHGHQFEGHTNATSFLTAFQKAERTPPYDLVIIDIMLGRQLGTDIVDALQARELTAMPIILMSAGSENLLTTIKDRYPTIPILKKPFRIQLLLTLVDSAFQAQRKGSDYNTTRERASEESARIDALLPGYVLWPAVNN